MIDRFDMDVEFYDNYAEITPIQSLDGEYCKWVDVVNVLQEYEYLLREKDELLDKLNKD